MNRKKRKILFICFHHSWNDPRLYYRQAKNLISDSSPVEVEIAFIKNKFRPAFGENQYPEDIKILSLSPEKENESSAYSSTQSHNVFFRILNKGKKFVKKIRLHLMKYRLALDFKPDVVQASDIREITFAFALKLITGCKIVYDSHEDYFNFFYELGDKTIRTRISGFYYVIIEWLLIRFFDSVFCAADYLYEKYQHPSFGIKKLYLLRNFPNKDVSGLSRSEHSKSNCLELVYIGSINKYRGVIEAAEFVERFNTSHPHLSINFSYYGLKTPLVQKLIEKNRIRYKGSRSYEALISEITRYDVGLSTLLPIKKHIRSTPMKNFEYMLAGLPVLSSNFGASKLYIEEAKAGICIDPTSYYEFENAILYLFDDKVRDKLGSNGFSQIQNQWYFRREALPYLQEMLDDFYVHHNATAGKK